MKTQQLIPVTILCTGLFYGTTVAAEKTIPLAVQTSLAGQAMVTSTSAPQEARQQTEPDPVVIQRNQLQQRRELQNKARALALPAIGSGR